jgi:hypothetical protein
MPFVSKHQQRFFFAAESRGELPAGTARRWAHETDFSKLPEKKKEEKHQKKKACSLRELILNCYRDYGK